VLEKVYVVTDERHRAHQKRVLMWVFMAHDASRPPKAVQVDRLGGLSRRNL